MKEKSRKVLVVVDNSFDADIRVKNEVTILKESGFDVTVLCFQFDSDEVEAYDDLSVHRISIKRKLKNRLFLVASWLPFYTNFWSKRIRTELESNNYDLIISHDLYMIAPVHKARSRHHKDLSFIIDLHEHYPAAVESYSWAQGLIRRQLCRPWIWYEREIKDLQYPDLCITLSDSFSERLSHLTKRPLDDFFSFPNITPIPELLDFNPELPFAESDIVFMYYGAIADRRGIFDLFDAFLGIQDSENRAKLLLIGPVDKSDSNRFNDYLIHPKLADKVHYIPWIESKYWRNYAEVSHFCLAPFHVNPQHNSGVANKIFQYIQAGKFIIASNCKPQKQLIDQFDCGIIYETPAQFIEVMNDCIQNTDKYEQKAIEAARSFNSINFPRKNAQHYVERINQLLN